MSDTVTFEKKLEAWEKKFVKVLPAEYRHRRISDLPEGDDRSRFEAHSTEEDTFGFLLMGPSGIGKTYILTAIMNSVLWKSHHYNLKLPDMVAYYPVGYLIHRLRTIKNPTEFDECITVKFLFLDDLGTENTTDFAREHFFTILDLRCQKKLPTFITSNLSLNEITEKYGERITSRLKEMCLPFPLKGIDRRSGIMMDNASTLKKRRLQLVDKTNV